MYFISRVRLDPSRRATMLAMLSYSKFHGALECGREGISRDERRLLWRIDQLSGDYYLLIVSPEKLDLTELSRQFGYGSKGIETKDYTPFLDSITPGSRWIFRLTANPSISRRQNNPAGFNRNERGKVVDCRSNEQLLTWLLSKSDRNGFTVEPSHFQCTSVQNVTFKKHGDGKLVSFKEASYEGVLTVTDPQKFIFALTHGIGREKAYGMGLMTVIPLKSKS